VCTGSRICSAVLSFRIHWTADAQILGKELTLGKQVLEIFEEETLSDHQIKDKTERFKDF
jgi:hypothetical protein